MEYDIRLYLNYAERDLISTVKEKLFTENITNLIFNYKLVSKINLSTGLSTIIIS